MSGQADGAGFRVWIRADGNAAIASGHLRRCLSVADALRALGCAVCFLVADGESAAVLDGMLGEEVSATGDAGIVIQILQTDYKHPETDTTALGALYRSDAPDLLLIDSYFMQEADFLRLGAALPGLSLAYIDDLAVCDPPVDLLVNYGVKPPAGRYQSAKRKLLGSVYAPLRRQFAEAGRDYAVRERVERVLLTTGGTDPYRMGERIVGAIQREPALASCWIEAVLPTIDEAQEKTAVLDGGTDKDGGGPRGERLRLHRGVTEMAALMASCDLAVSAGGTTLYELCAVGVPTVAFSMADNQRDFAGRLAEVGAIACVGDVRTGTSDGAAENGESMRADAAARQIASWLAVQTTDAAGRCRQSERMRDVTDGRGAARIAEAIVEVIKERRGAA